MLFIKVVSIMKRFFNIFVTLAVLFSAISCEVGLGESVDTDAPTVTISYPPSSAAIMGTFTFAGTCADDKDVTAVSVSVKNTDSGALLETKSATVAGGSWSVSLNSYSEGSGYNGWKYPDGNYEISVTARDEAGHSSGTSSRAFTIDNTPPVLVITNPVSVGSDTAEAFGRKVQLTGTFSEQTNSKIDSLVVDFYNEDGTFACESSFSNITDMTSASPLSIAEYYATEEPATNEEKNYLALYGATNMQNPASAGTVVHYFTVTAYDGARNYTSPGSGASGKGNATKVFYRGTKVLSNLIDSSFAEAPSFTVTTLRNYLNKTSSDYSADSTFTDSDGAYTLQDILDGAKTISVAETSITQYTSNTSTTDVSGNPTPVYPKFSMNPNNNPTYAIGGFGLGKASSGSGTLNSSDSFYYTNYYDGNPLNLTLSPGLDNKNLDTSTITVYYYDLANPATKYVLWTWNESVALAYAKLMNPDLSDSAALTAINGDPATYHYTKTTAGASNSSLAVESKIESSVFKGGHYYAFSVEGHDIAKNEIASASDFGYGFYAKINAEAPTVEITSGKEDFAVVSKDDFCSGNFAWEIKAISSKTELSDFYSDIAIKKNGSSASENFHDELLTSATKTSSGGEHSYTGKVTIPTARSSIFTEEGLYSVTLTVTATNSGGTTSTTRKIYVDTASPSIKNMSLEGYKVSDETKASEGVSASTVMIGGKAETLYYVNNSAAYNFTLSGVSTDNYTLDSTTFVLNGAASKVLTPLADVNDDMTWSFTITGSDLATFATQSGDYDASLTVTTKDSAGNTGESTVYLKFDTTVPTAKHAFDKNGKDMVFRMGTSDNESEELTAAGLTWDDAADKDVGGKYHVGTWGNSQTITIRGDWKEDGSGLAMIYYKSYPTLPTSDDLSAFLSDYAGQADGKFAPLNEPITRRVSYTNSSGAKVFANVDSSYKTTITGLTIGNNYLALVAVDKVGNAGLDSLYAKDYNNSSAGENITWNNSIPAYSLNVDTESPILSSNKSGQQYTNGVSPVTVSGTATDNASGVSSVTISVNGRSLVAPLASVSTSVTWSVEIGADILSTLEDGRSYPVTASISDLAGNVSSSSVFTLSKDVTAPDAAISTVLTHETSSVLPSDSLNGNIDISGKVTSSGAEPAAFTLYYSLVKPTSSITIDNLTAIGSVEDISKIYSWNFEEFDVNTAAGLSESAPKKQIYLVPVVTDTAGNCNIYKDTISGSTLTRTYSYKEGTGANYFAYTVDLDADRPVISLSNVKSSGGTLTVTTVYGSVTDDDGTVANGDFQISENNGETWNLPTTYQNGSWTYVLQNTDQSTAVEALKTLLFKVKDAAGTTFTSNKGSLSTLTQPKVRGASYSTDPDDSSTYAQFTLDTNPPEISTVLVDYDGNRKALSNGTVYGNSTATAKKTIKLHILTKDTSGIQGVTASFGDSDPIDALNESAPAILTYKDNSGNDLSVDTAGWDYWTATLDVPTGKISALESIKVVSTDKNSSSQTFSRDVIVDNKAPTASSLYPASGTQVTGSVEMRGVTSDGDDSSGVKSVKFYIPSNNDVAAWNSNSTYAESSSVSWTELTGTVSWSIPFTATETSSVYCQPGLRYFHSEIDSDGNATWYNYPQGGSESVTYGTEISEGIYALPIYLRLEDSAGNIGYVTDYVLNVDPDGDRPSVTVTTPSSKEAVRNILGGTINIYGSATDNVSVQAVHIQIQKQTDSNTYADASGYSDVTVNGSSSWNYSFKSGDLVPAGSELDLLRFRVWAEDNNGLLGAKSDWYYIKVDQDTPKIGSAKALTLVRYVENDAGSGDIISKQTYTDGMWISGTWWLTFSLEDTNGIDIASDKTYVESATLVEGTATVDSFDLGDATASTDGSHNNYLEAKVKISTVGTGSLTSQIFVTDNSDPVRTSYKDISFKFDNTAPEQKIITNSSGTKIGLESADGSTTTIEQSNLSFSIKSSVTESGSGLSFAAVYLQRKRSSASDTIYQPYYSSGAWNVKEITVDGTNVKIDSSKVTNNGLPYRTYSCTRDEDDSLILPAEDPYITKGSIIKLAGIYRTVSSVSGSEISFTPADTTRSTSVDVIYAMVVDNAKTETLTNGVLGSNDDGDDIYDHIEDDDWVLGFDSSVIPDGPLFVNYLATDKAGNVSDLKSEATFVTNNRPRIAQIYLATDLSGDGNFTDGSNGSINEISRYSTLEEDPIRGWMGVSEAKVNALGNSSNSAYSKFIAKADSQMRFEITGGNGDMYYQWTSKNATAASDSYTVGSQTATKGLIKFDSHEESSITVDKTTFNTKVYAIPLAIDSSAGVGNEILAGIGNGGAEFIVKLWDSADETTPGSDSLSATAKVAFNIAVQDKNKPHAGIYPFFWNSANNNSLYNNSRENGHIELEKDLETISDTWTSPFTETSGEMDKDPKVSGKISFHGIAYDDQRITALYMAIVAKDGTTGNFTFTGNAGDDKTKTEGGATFYKIADFSGDWTTYGSMEDDGDGWHSSVINNYLTMYGHSASWQVDWDSAKLTGIVGTDKMVRIFAVDKGGNISSLSTSASETVAENAAVPVYTEGGTAVAATFKPYYRIDVVPYVVRIGTSLDSLNSNDPTKYSRTALGHYPVYTHADSTTDGSMNTSYEKVKVYGFNLTNAYYSTSGDMSASSTTSEYYDVLDFTIPSTLSSGEIEFTNGSCKTLNNLNNDEAMGDYVTTLTSSTTEKDKGTIYANYYNRQPNNSNNNNLTDLLYIDVWQFNSSAVVPISGKVKLPVMKIVPGKTDGQLGFAFADGPLYFDMYNDGYSYIYSTASFDEMDGIGLTFTSNGKAFATVNGGDTNSSEADKFVLMSSQWGKGFNSTGTNRRYSTYYGSNSIRIGAIGRLNSDTNTDIDFDTEGFRSPSLVTHPGANSTTDVYLAYYDRLNDEIRLKYGSLSETSTGHEAFGMFQTTENANAPKHYNDNAKQVYVVADKNRSGAASGEYVCLGVVPSNTAGGEKLVIVWYDSYSNKMLYSYNSSPTSKINPGHWNGNTTWKNPTSNLTETVDNWSSADAWTSQGWSAPESIFTGGEYCQVAVDQNGGIHMAGYNGTSGNLLYAYKSSVTGTTQTCIVDSADIVGTDITLDVAIDTETNKPVPYISYFSMSQQKPKFAYLPGGVSSSVSEGASSDYFTGKWEVSLVPTTSTIPQGKISSGVWKDSNGKLSQPSGTVGSSYYKHTPNSYSSTNYGQVYANGTNNAVLAYARKVSGSSSYIETAQKK